MTRERDIDRILDLWFAERPTEVADRVLDEVAERIGRQPQEPAWLTLWRDSHVNSYLKYAAAVAAVILLAAVGFAVLRPSGGGIGGQPVSPPASILGTYATSFTQGELGASPDLYDSGEINNENWGDFTLTFGGDGRVTMAQSNALASSSTSGTYAIDGDHIELAFDEGVNRGETFGGRWSLDRDTLTFERIDCRDPRVPCFRGSEELPTPYLVKVWTRAP